MFYYFEPSSQILCMLAIVMQLLYNPSPLIDFIDQYFGEITSLL